MPQAQNSKKGKQTKQEPGKEAPKKHEPKSEPKRKMR